VGAEGGRGSALKWMLQYDDTRYEEQGAVCQLGMSNEAKVATQALL
jgi:hypothetical protein